MMSSGTAATATNLCGLTGKGNGGQQAVMPMSRDKGCYSFQMPLHYPRYRKADYEAMPEWKLDCLLSQYGLPVTGDLNHKRKFAMGAFLWPDQDQDH